MSSNTGSGASRASCSCASMAPSAYAALAPARTVTITIETTRTKLIVVIRISQGANRANAGPLSVTGDPAQKRSLRLTKSGSELPISGARSVAVRILA